MNNLAGIGRRPPAAFPGGRVTVSGTGHLVQRCQSLEVPVGQIVAAEYVSVDGVMQDPGGVGEIEAGGWTNPYWNDELAKLQADLLFASDALLLGRVTYEGFAAAWPGMEQEEGQFAVKMNTMPKYVASRTLTDMEWNATPIRGMWPARSPSSNAIPAKIC
jgi:hypothetical protein